MKGELLPQIVEIFEKLTELEKSVEEQLHRVEEDYDEWEKHFYDIERQLRVKDYVFKSLENIIQAKFLEEPEQTVDPDYVSGLSGCDYCHHGSEEECDD